MTSLVMRGSGPERSRPQRRIRSVATTLALFASSLVAPQLGAESRLSALLGMRSAIAAPVISTGARKKAKLALKAKLGKVPVFMVTNGGGSPFLNKLASGDQSAVMFLFPSDAQRMLKAVLKAPNGASSGAKVLLSCTVLPPTCPMGPQRSPTLPYGLPSISHATLRPPLFSHAASPLLPRCLPSSSTLPPRCCPPTSIARSSLR